MRFLLIFLALSASLAVLSEAVGAEKKLQNAPSTAANPNFGHANWDLWRDKNHKREKRYYYYYHRHHYYYYNRRYYYYYSRPYYYYYYNNYYYYYGKRK